MPLVTDLQRDRPEAVEMVQESLEFLEKRVNELRDEIPAYKKSRTQLDQVYQGLVDDPSPSGSLTTCGQILLTEHIKKVDDTVDKYVKTHRNIHSSISRIGKDIGRNFCESTGGLIKNEKHIESDPKCARNVSNLIVNYLMSTGHPEIAETYVQECNLHGRLDEYTAIKDTVGKVIESFRQHNTIPAINYIELNAPQEKRLIFDLVRHQVLELIKQGKKLEALTLSRKLSGLGSDGEVAQIMGALFTKADDTRFNEISSPLAWQQLESRLSEVIFKCKSILPQILETGCQAVPALLNLRSVMAPRQDQIFSSDELPIEIPIEKRYHSTFTCPILRVQTTERNPPYRLRCGHVISKDALEKLASNSRHSLLKCPYCPDESSKDQALRVFL